MAIRRLETAVVTIQYVEKARTTDADGVQAWVIGAEKTTGDSAGERILSFRTRQALKASLCERAKATNRKLFVKFQDVGYFDFHLLWCEFAGE